MSAAAPTSAADGRLGHTTGVVLCAGSGGVSSRVHALRVGDATLAERAACLLGEICAHVVRVGAAPIDEPSGRVAATLAADASELEALVAALDAVSTDHALVLSADRPLLPPDLLIGLAGLPDADAAVPRDARGVHATCARYRVATAGPALRAAVASGADDPGAVLGRLEVEWLEGEALASLDPTGEGLERVRDASALEALAAAHPGRLAGAWPGHPGAGLRAPG